MGGAIRVVVALVTGLALPAALSSCASAPHAPPRTAAERQLDLESFDYVWTTIRDKHIDPTLGGLDWQTVRAEFRPRVERAQDVDEVRAALLVSAIERLPNGDGFRYVTANFVVPSGTAVEGVGITPDVEVSHTQAALLAGRDLMLEAATAWIRAQEKGD